MQIIRTNILWEQKARCAIEAKKKKKEAAKLRSFGDAASWQLLPYRCSHFQKALAQLDIRHASDVALTPNPTMQQAAASGGNDASDVAWRSGHPRCRRYFFSREANGWLCRLPSLMLFSLMGSLSIGKSCRRELEICHEFVPCLRFKTNMRRCLNAKAGRGVGGYWGRWQPVWLPADCKVAWLSGMIYVRPRRRLVETESVHDAPTVRRCPQLLQRTKKGALSQHCSLTNDCGGGVYRWKSWWGDGPRDSFFRRAQGNLPNTT